MCCLALAGADQDRSSPAPAPGAAADIMDAINQARLSATRALKLQAGDVLVLDNFRCVCVCMCAGDGARGARYV